MWGIEGLVGQDTYGPEEECKKKHRKNARGHVLNTVVVDRWNSKPGRPDEEVVLLTNLPVPDALRVFDQYDDRAWTAIPTPPIRPLIRLASAAGGDRCSTTMPAK